MALAWGDPSRLLIGLNCIRPFGWGRSSGASYVYTGGGPFDAVGTDATVMPDDRLAAILAAGFDFVRMAVDVACLCCAPDDDTLDRLNDEIITGAERRVAAGLRVIVDMHLLGNGQHPVTGWAQAQMVDGTSGPKWTRLKYVVARLATAMEAASATIPPDRVCLELLNEPASAPAFDAGGDTYNVQMKDYFDAVRAVCSLTLVVGGSNNNALDGVASGDSTSGLSHMVATDFDANTAFAFHHYEPGVFSHQGVTGTIYEDMHGLTFPCADYPGGQAQAEADFTAAAILAGHQSNIAPVVTNTTWSSSLNKAFTQYGTKAMLATRLAVATAWADAASVDRRRLFHTEGGVNFGAADVLGISGDATVKSAAAYILAQAQNNVAAGTGTLTIHEMQGSNFGIQAGSSPWGFTLPILAGLLGLECFIYNGGSYALRHGDVDFLADDIECVLVKDTYTPDRDHTSAVYATAEISGVSGYTGGWNGSGRKLLSGKTLTNAPSTDRTVYDADNPSAWTLGPGDTLGGVIIGKKGASDDTTAVPLFYLGFLAGPTNGGTFSLALPADGIALTQQ